MKAQINVPAYPQLHEPVAAQASIPTDPQTHIHTDQQVHIPTRASERLKRLSIDMPATLHRRFKVACVATDKVMVEEVLAFIKRRTAERARRAARALDAFVREAERVNDFGTPCVMRLASKEV